LNLLQSHQTDLQALNLCRRSKNRGDLRNSSEKKKSRRSETEISIHLR
jgi:hypothetical protein